MKPKFTDTHRYRAGYVESVDTDIKATFRRIERERKAKEAEAEAARIAQAEQDARNAAEAQQKTIPLKKARTV